MSKGRLHFANRKELLIILIFLAATAITAFASHNNVKKGSVAVIQCGNTVYTADLSVSGNSALTNAVIPFLKSTAEKSV